MERVVGEESAETRRGLVGASRIDVLRARQKTKAEPHKGCRYLAYGKTIVRSLSNGFAGIARCNEHQGFMFVLATALHSAQNLSYSQGLKRRTVPYNESLSIARSSLLLAVSRMS